MKRRDLQLVAGAMCGLSALCSLYLVGLTSQTTGTTGSAHPTINYAADYLEEDVIAPNNNAVLDSKNMTSIADKSNTPERPVYHHRRLPPYHKRKPTTHVVSTSRVAEAHHPTVPARKSLPSWVCSQQARFDALYRTCGNASFADVDALSDEELTTLVTGFDADSPNLYVSEDLQLIACLHNKVGVTTLREVLVQNGEERARSTGRRVKLQKWRYAVRITNYTAQQIRSMLRTYRKFMFVRHPLSRVVSAWRDKLVREMSGNSSDRGTHYRDWIPDILHRLYPDLVIEPQDMEGWHVNFKSVIRYMMKGGINKHLQGPYEAACHPCTIKYDFIGKIETFDEDIHYLVDHYMEGLGASVKLNSWDTVRGRPDNNGYRKVLPEYWDVTDRMLDFVIRRYQRDFDQFGYMWRRNERTRYVEVGCTGGCC